MSKVLYDESPLVVNPEVAKVIGLNDAIILQQIHYWLVINEKAQRNFQEGYYWTYNTYEEWHEQFPFWSRNTIIRTIQRLEKKGFIFSANYNKMPQDKTKWYRIDYEALPKLSSASTHNGKAIKPKRVARGTNLGLPLPETTPEITSKTTTKEIKVKPSPSSNGTEVKTVFDGMRAFYRYPDETDKDPIPNYGKEGKAIKRMLERGFTVTGILDCWIKKCQKAGMFKSMVFVNEDIGEVPKVRRQDPDKFIKGKYGHMVQR